MHILITYAMLGMGQTLSMLAQIKFWGTQSAWYSNYYNLNMFMLAQYSNLDARCSLGTQSQKKSHNKWAKMSAISSDFSPFFTVQIFHHKNSSKFYLFSKLFFTKLYSTIVFSLKYSENKIDIRSL